MARPWTRKDMEQLESMTQRQDNRRWLAAMLDRRFEDVIKMAATLADKRKGPADIR